MTEGGIGKTIEKVADAINKIGLPLLALAIAIVSGGFLWLSDKRLQTMKVLSFRNAHADWIAVAFWVCAVFVVLNWSTRIPRIIKGIGAEKRYRKQISKWLQKCTPDERKILRQFLIDQTRSLRLPSENPAVSSLSQNNMIWRPSQIMSPKLDYSTVPGGLTYPAIYHINEVVWDLLKENPNLVS